MNQAKVAKAQQKFITQNEVNFHVQQQQQQFMKNFDGQFGQSGDFGQLTGQSLGPRRQPVSSGPVSVQSSISQPNQTVSGNMYRQGSGNPAMNQNYMGMNRAMAPSGYAQQQLNQNMKSVNDRSPQQIKQTAQMAQMQQQISGGHHRKNKKSHFVVSDTGNILEMPGSLQTKAKIQGPGMSKQQPRGPSGVKLKQENYNNSNQRTSQGLGDKKATQAGFSQFYGNEGYAQFQGAGMPQQYPRTEVNSNLQSINSSSANIHENLQMRLNKKRIIQSNGSNVQENLNIEQAQGPHHQRIQSNPAYLVGYGNSNNTLNSNNAAVRSQQQIDSVAQGNQVHSQQTAQRPMILSKNQTSQKRAPTMKQQSKIGTQKASIEGDPNTLDRALNTLGVETGAMSRQDAVGQQSSIAFKKNKGTQQKNMTNSSTFSKKGGNALVSKDAINSVGNGTQTGMQKTFDNQHQKLSFDQNNRYQGNQAVRYPQQISQSHAQSSPTGHLSTVSPLTKKDVKNKTIVQSQNVGTIGPTPNTVGATQKKIKQNNGQSPGTHAVQQIQSAHRRNLSDQVQLQQTKSKKYTVQQQKPTHMRAQTGTNYQVQEMSHQLEPPNVVNSDPANGRIVVINNNNTNINIHHQGTFQQPSQSSMANLQNIQQNYNMNNVGHQFQGTANFGNNSHISKTVQQQPKSLTHQNQSIRSSFNNSLVGGQGGTASNAAFNQESVPGFNQLSEVLNPHQSNKVYENTMPNTQGNSQKQSRKIIQKAKLDTWVKGVSTQAQNKSQKQQVPQQPKFINNISTGAQNMMNADIDAKVVQNRTQARGQVGSVNSGNSSGFRGSLQSRGVSRGKTISQNQNMPGPQNPASQTQNRFMKSSNQILIANNQQTHQQKAQSKQQLRRTIKNLSLSSNKQMQVKPNPGDRSNVMPSSERALIPYQHQKQFSGDSLHNQIQSIDKMNKVNTGFSASAAQLGRESIGKPQGSFSQQYDPNQYPQNSNTYYQMNDGTNFQSLANMSEHADAQNMFIIKQQNNYVNSGQISSSMNSVQVQGGIKNSMGNIAAQKPKYKHQKKPSAGATLSKGQKQLRQILSNQQQFNNLSQSPSKQSFDQNMVHHQPLNSFNHVNPNTQGNSLLNSQAQFQQNTYVVRPSHQGGFSQDNGRGYTADSMGQSPDRGNNIKGSKQQLNGLKLGNRGVQKPALNSQFVISKSSPYDTRKKSGQVQRGQQDLSEDNSRENTNRGGLRQNSESIYSDPYPMRDAYSQPESPVHYRDAVQNKRISESNKPSNIQKESKQQYYNGQSARSERYTYEHERVNCQPSDLSNLTDKSKVLAKNMNTHQDMLRAKSKENNRKLGKGQPQMKGDTTLPHSSKQDYGRETNSSGLQSAYPMKLESGDPRQQIYNNILFNIKNGVYDTKPEYYKVGKVIGKGAFGKVNLAIHRLTCKFVALKSIAKSMMNDESSLKKVRQEYNILKRARHQNIVRLYESYDTEAHIVYVMEVCGGGDLLTYVRRRRKLKEDYAKFLFGQIISGLQYVHSKGVLHRDIKLDNILLTSEGDVKICDFGVSKLVQSKTALQTEQCGTPAYIAPEVFKGRGYRGYQSDIWSAGVVLYAMLYGTVPFKATNMVQLQEQIINVQCNWGNAGDVSVPALTMLKKILEPDPNKRLTPTQILNDPWMQLTEAQIKQVEVFSQYEKEKIEKEFEYYNQKKEGDLGEDPFLEQMLVTTQNSVFRNNTTKSVILAPFNSTKSHISENFHLNESVQEILMPKDIVLFADKCKEVNRQYMLNNNAELDNGVYNENEQEEAKKEQENEDGLMGMNQQIEDLPPPPVAPESQQVSAPNSAPVSNIQSNKNSNLQSLNTSQIMVDEERVEKMNELFGFPTEYVIDNLENDELNHASSTYFLLNVGKEY